MATMSVSVPENMKEIMERMEDVNWSAVARKAFEEKIKQIEFLNSISNRSKLSEKDANDIADRINTKVSKKFREM